MKVAPPASRPGSRLPTVVIVVILLMLSVGCGRVGRESSGRAGLDSRYFAPAQLPEGLQLHFACATSPDEAVQMTVLGYRGDGRYKTAERHETALLRIFGYHGEQGGTVGRADSGSIEEVTIRGHPGRSFTITTAEPIPAPWPAITWTEGDSLAMEIVGEGLDHEAVLAVAESLEPLTQEQFNEMTADHSVPCGP